MEKKITYMYPMLGTGRVAIAIRYVPKFDGNQTVELAFAFCSPKDQFKRDEGRAKATYRLNSGQTVAVAVGVDEYIKEKAIDKLLEMTNLGLCPSWARKLRACRDSRCCVCYLDDLAF